MAADPSASDIEHAYRTFACHLIATVFEDLKAWAVPYSEFKAAQRAQLQKEFENTDLLEIFAFFVGSPGELSGMNNLIQGLELKLDANRVVVPVLPLLRKALAEANLFRESRGLEPYPHPAYDRHAVGT